MLYSLKIHYLHTFSPILYCIFVKFCQIYFESYTSDFRFKLRKYHNINLAICSFVMLIGITYGTWQESKFDSLYQMICGSFNNNMYATISAKLFVWSKYLEWIDTMMLHLFGKPISWLQYIHHSTTAIICWYNLIDDNEYNLTPYSFICTGINCFVHIPMYWYFAYPKGMLKRWNKTITVMQMIQHTICLIITGSTLWMRETCKQNLIGNILLFYGYVQNWLLFANFYIKKYNTSRTSFAPIKNE